MVFTKIQASEKKYNIWQYPIMNNKIIIIIIRYLKIKKSTKAIWKVDLAIKNKN